MNIFFQSLLSVLVGFLFTSGVTYLLRGRILSFVEEEVVKAVDVYLQEQVRQLLENPSQVAKTLSPLIQALLQEALRDFERGNRSQSLNLFGFKVPAEIAQLFIQRFLGGNSEKNINPFG